MELLAEDCKEKGNECMKQEKYIEAMLHYTRGIKVEPHSPHLYSNRSLAFLQMQQYHHAVEDAKTVIQMLPKWVKGYYRKAEIECAVEHYQEAIESYKQGLAIHPDEKALKDGLAKATYSLQAQRRSENRIPWYGLALGALVGTLLVVLDEVVAKKPLFENDLLRVLVLIGLIGICYIMGLLYRYFLQSQRASLLEAPPDLLGDIGLERSSTQPATTSTTSRSHLTSSSSSNSSLSGATPHQRKKAQH